MKTQVVKQVVVQVTKSALVVKSGVKAGPTIRVIDH
jgi:hypothetical protein